MASRTFENTSCASACLTVARRRTPELGCCGPIENHDPDVGCSRQRRCCRKPRKVGPEEQLRENHGLLAPTGVCSGGRCIRPSLVLLRLNLDTAEAQEPPYWSWAACAGQLPMTCNTSGARCRPQFGEPLLQVLGAIPPWPSFSQASRKVRHEGRERHDSGVWQSGHGLDTSPIVSEIARLTCSASTSA